MPNSETQNPDVKDASTELDIETLAAKAAEDNEKKRKRIADAIELDEAREKARLERAALRSAAEKDQLTDEQRDKYSAMVLAAVRMPAAHAVDTVAEHPLVIQGKSFLIPSGLLSVAGKSVSGKTFAFQWRFAYATASNPTVITINEPVPGSLPAPKTKGEMEGLYKAIEDLSAEHKVIILNSLTFLLGWDPSNPEAKQATKGGTYAGLTNAIYDIDALAKRLNIVLIGVFNTAQYEDIVLSTLIGRSTSAFAVNADHTATWSTRRYKAVQTNAGWCIDESKREAITFPPLELKDAQSTTEAEMRYIDLVEDLDGVGAGDYLEQSDV